MSLLQPRRAPGPAPSGPDPAVQELAALRAVVDQVDAAVDEALHCGTRQARIDKLLDIRNLIRPTAAPVGEVADA